MMDRFNEFYMMQNQAKKYEQSGLEDKALELYLKIIQEYMPNNDFSYDRATAILEKKARYEEALQICEKAIQGMKSGDFQGDHEKFQKRIARIRGKINDLQTVSPVVSDSESIKWGLPGFRTRQKTFMIAGTLYYALAVFASFPNDLYTFLFFFFLGFVGSYGLEFLIKVSKKQRCLKCFLVALVSLGISGYCLSQIPAVQTYWNPEGINASQDSGDRTGDGTSQTATPDTGQEPPEIPPEYLEKTASSPKANPAFEQAQVSVNGKTIYMSVIVKAGTSEDEYNAIAEEMMKTLGGLMTSEKLKGPSKEAPGELYNFYGVVLDVQNTLSEKVAEGIYGKEGYTINWKAPQKN